MFLRVKALCNSATECIYIMNAMAISFSMLKCSIFVVSLFQFCKNERPERHNSPYLKTLS